MSQKTKSNANTQNLTNTRNPRVLFLYHPHMRYALLIAITLLGYLLASGCANTQTKTTEPIPALHNLYQLTDTLYSGSEPKGRAAYQQLASLGIQTVISVDAVAPDKALADEFGIKIVHLPIGYEGISDQRAIEFAHAIATLPTPIYVHCHHGKHRGPAALAVGAIGAGQLNHTQAHKFMTAVGTSPDYPGLWKAMKHARPLTDSYLFNNQIELPEQADIGDFESAMSEIDRLTELLWLCADNNFAAPDDHPDLAPASLAGQIHNLLRSLGDDALTEQGGLIFQELLGDSTALASRVENQIIAADIENAMISMTTLSESCIRCHERFRD